MSEPNAFEKFMNWASSNPLVQGAANFLSDPVKSIKNVGYDIKSTFGGYDPRETHFTITDDNGTEHEYDFGSGGYIYKTPSGEHTSHRGYAYLNVGNDGRLKLNVSKSVAESDWFKTQFTENDTFKKVIKMFNANPASNTTLTTTDKDGNVKNVTLAEALKQYNDALGEYASNYEGISYLRDYYKNNTGLTLTDDQIRISESTINKDEDSKNESKVIYIPDSWNAIYDFKQLPSWNGDTKTVSAKDFFDVYNLDEKGSITEEQWNALSDAAEAELENAFSGRVAKNLNTEDPEAIKYAGDKLAKAIAASKTINGSKPDVSGVHATGIFLSSLGEQFTSSLSNTYGNIGEFIVAQGEWLTNSPVAPISWAGERIEDAVFLTNTPANAVLVAMGAIGEDIANGRITPDTASDYVAEVRDSLEKLWATTHGDLDYKEYQIPVFGGHSINEITETFDKDISYMEKISKAAAGGKFVGNLLELGVEVWATEATGTAVGEAIETTGMNIGRGLGLAFKGSKIKDQTSIVTKLYMVANKATAFTGNMMVQGFMDTVESDAGTLMAKLLSSGELSEQEKQELTTAMTANTLYNIGGEMVVGKLVPKFLETKPGRFVKTRAQRAIAAASLPFKKGQIGFAKLINGVVNGKTPTKAMEDIAQKYAFSFGVNSLNEYNVKLAEANYEATKSIATAKEGKEYTNAITGNKLKASSTTQAIETAVMNKMYYQNMVDRISKGFRAEVNEIMNTPDIAKAKTSAEKANAGVLVAEKSAGKKPVTFETGNGAQVVAKAQDDANYLIYKNRLEVMNNKEAALKAAKKTLSTSDEEFKSALENAVRGFEATNDPRLVAALNEYYLANLSLNKALTDWEVKHGLISEETYESLRKTGFFGPDDELYMKTMRINKNGPNVTDDYMAAVSNYANSYYKTMQESYRVNPVYDSDQHIARFFDPEANYIDPLLASNARIGAMALAYQANNWGKALKGIGMPMEEMDTLGKATSHKEVAEAMSSAKKAAATAIGNLQVDELQLSLSGKDIDEFVTLGKSEYEGYNLEERIKDTEGRLARKLGIADNDQVSRNVKMLSDEQIVSTIDAIPESPAYGAVKNYDELTAMQDSIPTKEMKAKANKMMETQGKESSKAYNERLKKYKTEKKVKFEEAVSLEKRADILESDVKKFEKAKADAEAKANAEYERKVKKAEKEAETAAKKASKVNNASKNKGIDAAEKQLAKDARDAVLYDSNTDFNHWEKEYSADDVRKELSEERRKEVADILKDDFELEKIMSLEKVKPEDVLKPEYIESVRAKYGGGEQTLLTDKDQKAVNKFFGFKDDGMKDYIYANTVAGVKDGHSYKTDAKYDDFYGVAKNEGYDRFLSDNLEDTSWFYKEDGSLAQNYDLEKYNQATEQIVTPGGIIDYINEKLRSGELSFDKTEKEIKDIIRDNISVSTVVANAHGWADELLDASYAGLDSDFLIDEYEKYLKSLDGGKKWEEFKKENKGKPFTTFYDFEKDLEKKIKDVLTDEVFNTLKKGTDTLENDVVLYRVLFSDGNRVGNGDMAWIKKPYGEYSDPAAGFVTLDEAKVLESKAFDGKGDAYVLRIHAPEGTGAFAFDGDTVIPITDMAAAFSGAEYMKSSGHRAGGELALAPGQHGKFVHTGERVPGYGDVEYVDVYLDGYKMREDDVKKIRNASKLSSENDAYMQAYKAAAPEKPKADEGFYRTMSVYPKDQGSVSPEELATHNIPKRVPTPPGFVKNAKAPEDYGSTRYINRGKTFDDLAYEAKKTKERFDELVANRNKLMENGWKDDLGRDTTVRTPLNDEFNAASLAENLDEEITLTYEKYMDSIKKLNIKVSAESRISRKRAAELREEAEALSEPKKLSEKRQLVKNWNDAVKKTTMVNDLNKMWLQDAITNKGVEIPEGVMAYIKDQIANAKLAEHTEIDLIDSLVMRSKNPAKTAESIEKWLDEYNKLDEDLQKMKELLNLKGEGTDPFTRASKNILDTITEKTGKILSGNPASKRIIEMAKEQGVDTELVKEYLSINALLRENGNGDLVLRDDVQKAIKERLLKEMYAQKGNEGNLTPGMQEKVIKDFQGIAQETAKSKWAIAQEKLTSAGGNDFVDVEKSFKQVEKEMETFVGQFNSTNVVPMMNANGELKYYKVSPLVADIYMNRPIASYGKLSNWFNNMSKISRVSKTTLNATSVINQCFRDPLNAYIGAGMYKGFRAYEKEMAEIFGPELVAQLQDSMSKAGWDAFTEGGKISGTELQKKAARYVVEDSGVNTFAKETTENALFESRRTALRGARMGALDNLDVWNKHYKKAKISLNEFADKFQKAAGAPGYIINESRELFLRKADYASAFNTALRQGKTMLEAKNIAEFVSRHATTNFGRTFMWGNSIVNATPFLGAAINGSASFWRLVAMDPVGVFSRFVTAGMATMSIVAQSMTTKRDRDVYKTIPEWMKQENVVFVYDGEVFKIPIPQEMGALLAPFRQAVEKSNPGVQSHAWLELLCNDMLELSPISLDGFETLDEINLDSDPTFFDRMSRESSALIAQIAPPLLKTAYMAQVGVDPYTGNPIDTSYKWIDGDGNIQIMDSNQSSFANFISDKLDWFGEKKSASFWYKTMDSFFGTGIMNIVDGVTNIFSGDVVGGVTGFVGTQLEKGLNAVNVRDYQLQDPYLREFKATIKELEEEKNKLLAPDGELALLSQKMSMLSPTDAKYDELKKRYIQQYNQITEDYRQRVLSTVQNYNNNYGSTYTINQFAAVTNLLVFQESTLMPLNAYQDEQLSQMYYSAREQAYQTMIDMGFDSPDDWSIFGVARRNKDTGEVYVKYASPTAILNMDNVAMGAGRVYSAELESALKNAGLTKSERIRRYAEANAKGKKAVKAFKQEWNAEVAQAIADTMYKYGASNVINSGDATSLLNKYFYISNTSYKVKDYLEDVFGKED